MKSVVIHGHFYQPPRENPWTGALDREDSARPYHDWNERINAECYRANAFARIVDGRGRPVRIVGNYGRINFNFGPTLLTWLERADPECYSRILEADRVSKVEHSGHGNAIAQGYNHAILPLCNERDRITQVKWGIADFRYRFGRDPESLWLPETACHDATLGTLIDAGLKYVILSPFQAERVRKIGEGEQDWKPVADGSIDPRRSYVYFHRDGSKRSIAVFFYDALVSRAIAFEGALSSSQGFVERLLRAASDGELVNVATDGESYGHHFHFGDRALAYAMFEEAPRRELKVTNYAEFLESHPPEYEIEIKPGPNGEGTSWSCFHGVGRWYRDCGCSTGGAEGWNQSWRGPLRAALDILRDEVAKHFEESGKALLRDPWAARENYIDVVLDHGRRDEFIKRHASRALSDDERIRSLTLLEMQRSSMLMYTSCGWFFSEISGLEAVQVMKYAGRVMDFMNELGFPSPETKFLERLAEARSNIPEMGNGADVYRRFVKGLRVTPARVAAHLAMASLASYGTDEGEIGDFAYHKIEYRMQEHGRLHLATGRIALEVTTTGKRHDFAAAALHLGGIDFYAALKPYPGDNEFHQMAESVWESFPGASLATILRKIQNAFGEQEFSLDDMLPDGRRAVGRMVFGDVLTSLTTQFVRLFEENRRVIEMLQGAGFELPPAVQQIAEFSLSRLFEDEVKAHLSTDDPEAYRRAIEIARDVMAHGYRIDKSETAVAFQARIEEKVREATSDPSEENIQSAVSLLELSHDLRLDLQLERAQESVYVALSKNGAKAAELKRLAIAVGLSPDIKVGPEENIARDGKPADHPAADAAANWP